MLTPLHSSDQSDNRLRTNTIVQLSLWLLTAVVLVLLFDHGLGWDRTLQAWSTMSVGQLTICFILLSVSYLARAARLHSHFSSEISGHFCRCLRIVLHHNFFNNILPMKTGEVVFPLLIHRHFGIKISRAAGALFSFRIADLVFLSLLSLLLAMLSMHLLELAGSAVLFFLIVMAAGCLLLLIIFKFRRSVTWIDKYWGQFKSGFPSNQGMMWTIFIWTTLAWSTKLIAYALILSVFVKSLFSVSLLAAASGELASSIPIHTPAAFGTFESGILAVLIPVGFDTKTALTAALNLHLFILANTVLLAALGLLIGRHSDDSG